MKKPFNVTLSENNALKYLKDLRNSHLKKKTGNALKVSIKAVNN